MWIMDIGAAAAKSLALTGLAIYLGWLVGGTISAASALSDLQQVQDRRMEQLDLLWRELEPERASQQPIDQQMLLSQAR